MTSTRRLNELGRIVTGRTPPTARPELFGCDFPFLTPTEMDDRKTIVSTERGVSGAGAAYLRNVLVPEGSLCVSCIGWQLGKVVKAGVPLFTNQQINTIIPNDQVNADYLYYVLKTLRDELHRLGSVGSRTPIVNKTRFGEIRIPVPELGRQRQIADTLSAYDDLIENNTRRIAILEEMAQRLYREWFVHFRYPGHESVPLVESELGPIPKGWQFVALGQVSDLNWGNTKLTKASYVAHGYLAFSAAGPDGYLPFFEHAFPGVVLSAIGNCGITWYATETWTCIKNTIRFWSIDNRASTEYLYYATRDPAIWPLRGSAQRFISQTDARTVRVLLPSSGVHSEFTTFVKAGLIIQDKLGRMNLALRGMRDELLRLLIPSH